jgi:hypothetical protein
VTKRKSIFGGPFVVQTFTVHFSATQGALYVPSIGDLGGPFVALALSAAAVCCLSVLKCLLVFTKLLSIYRLNER